MSEDMKDRFLLVCQQCRDFIAESVQKGEKHVEIRQCIDVLAGVSKETLYQLTKGKS